MFWIAHVSLLFIAEIYKPEDDDQEENMTTSECTDNVRPHSNVPI